MSKLDKSDPGAYKAALRLLRYRLRSENELFARLIKKFSPSEELRK